MNTLICAHCGSRFESDRKSVKYCRSACRWAAKRARILSTEEGREKRRQIGNRAYLKQRDKWIEKARAYAKTHREEQRLATRRWKAANPDKVAAHTTDYQTTRHLRVAAASDGTAGSAIAGLLRGSRCLYCNARLADLQDKRLDHMHPVALGGSHSAANLALACDPCNAKKGAMPFVDWLALLPEADRRRVTRHYIKLNGAPPDQLQLLMPVEPVKRPRPISAKKAEQDARKAWEWWLREGAPESWLDDYWAAHPRPWTDPRLTEAEQFAWQYRLDPGFRNKELVRRARWRARHKAVIGRPLSAMEAAAWQSQ